MSITPTPVVNFSGALYQFLYRVEGDVPFVYNDSKGIPTLGVGYALIQQAGVTWKPRDYQTDFANAKIVLSAAQIKALNDDLAAAAKALNNQAGGANPFSPASDNNNILNWSISTAQGQALFNTIISTYQTQVQTWLDNKTVYNSLQNSNEMLVLVSLAFNNLIGPDKSQTLKADILSGNRADAWYQIRYKTNKDSLAAIPPTDAPGIAKRRYYESQVFGLYSGTTDPVQMLKEAYDAYHTLQNHRTTIYAYESLYGEDLDGSAGQRDMIAEANNNYGLTGTNQVQNLIASFTPAETTLLNALHTQYSADTEIASALVAANFFSTNLYVADDSPSKSVVATNNAASLLLAGAGNVSVIGGSGYIRSRTASNLTANDDQWRIAA